MLLSFPTEKPSRRELRIFAWTMAALVGLAAARRQDDGIRLLLQVAAGAIFACGTVWPRLFQPILGLFGWATYPFRWILSQVALGLVFFGLILPLAIWFRLRGRDALGLRFNSEAATYWQPRTIDSDPRQYYRQF
jgi:hypothetical protein